MSCYVESEEQITVQCGEVSIHFPATYDISQLTALVEHSMQLPVFSGALFVFCNKRKDRLKILYWDKSGFCLWMKRLEKERFRWPIKATQETLDISEQEFRWLLQGLDIRKMKPHRALHYESVGL